MREEFPSSLNFTYPFTNDCSATAASGPWVQGTGTGRLRGHQPAPPGHFACLVGETRQ